MEPGHQPKHPKQQVPGVMLRSSRVTRSSRRATDSRAAVLASASAQPYTGGTMDAL